MTDFTLKEHAEDVLAALETEPAHIEAIRAEVTTNKEVWGDISNALFAKILLYLQQRGYITRDRNILSITFRGRQKLNLIFGLPPQPAHRI
jgi:DNA-binding PadR family transcriptional regulator